MKLKWLAVSKKTQYFHRTQCFCFFPCFVCLQPSDDLGVTETLRIWRGQIHERRSINSYKPKYRNRMDFERCFQRRHNKVHLWKTSLALTTRNCILRSRRLSWRVPQYRNPPPPKKNRNSQILSLNSFFSLSLNSAARFYISVCPQVSEHWTTFLASFLSIAFIHSATFSFLVSIIFQMTFLRLHKI